MLRSSRILAFRTATEKPSPREDSWSYVAPPETRAIIRDVRLFTTAGDGSLLTSVQIVLAGEVAGISIAYFHAVPEDFAYGFTCDLVMHAGDRLVVHTYLPQLHGYISGGILPELP